MVRTIPYAQMRDALAALGIEDLSTVHTITFRAHDIQVLRFVKNERGGLAMTEDRKAAQATIETITVDHKE